MSLPINRAVWCPIFALLLELLLKLAAFTGTEPSWMAWVLEHLLSGC